MLDFNLDLKCYGCTACSSICPVDAIEMISNDEGFQIPKINTEKCVNCGLCDKKCIVLNKQKRNIDLPPKALAIYSKNDGVRLNSASGGVFFNIAKNFINLGDNYFVCGCIWNAHLEAEHIISNKLDDLKKMQGSKYVQSNLKNCFRKIKKLLAEGNIILFSGTSCQISGLYSFIGYHENLYTCGLFCEGVPSPLVFESYKRFLEIKYKAKINDISFRSKKPYGWNQPYISIKLDNGKNIYENPTFNPYTMGFYDFLFLRNTCYNCQFKNQNYDCDILIGDFWKCKKELLDKSKNKGLSACFSLTDKGHELVNLMDNIEKDEVSAENVINGNPVLINSVNQNINREKFFNALSYKNFDKIVLENVRINTLKFKIKKIMNTLNIYPLWKKIKSKIVN